MKVIALKFENYRNLKDNIITPCDGVNIIYGDNAQGKTNLLEALWFFAEVTASEVQRTAKLSIGMRILRGLRCVFSVRSVSKQQILFRGGKKVRRNQRCAEKFSRRTD